jgi:serine/threonine-protein kinase
VNEETQELAAGVRAGDVLAGKYRIDRVLGVGGMGVVVAAHHLHLDDAVAIKFLLPEALKNEEAVRRFAREAQAAVRIKSEHVARVTDVGKLDNGSPYMVMEYLRGSDLSSWLEEHGRLPVEQAIEFVLQACEAIAEAHSLGIVHRDLKPANLFVIRRPDGSPSVKVLDFGISKRTGLGASGPTMTRTSAVMGSPLYMSPEQMRSARDADSRSDVWALGVILYELIGGDPPFTAESLPELVLKIVTDAPAKLRGKRPDVPEALERAIFACLEKDPVRRPQSVGALAALIAPYGPRRSAASVERISAVLRGAGTSPDTASSASSPRHQAPVDAKSANTVASWGQTASHARRGGVTAGIVAGSLLAIVASGVVGYRVFAASASKVDASATPVPPSAAVPVAPSVAPAVAPVSAARSAVEPSGTPPPSAPGKPEPPVVAPARAEQAPAPAPSAQKPVRAPRSTPRSPKPARGDVYDDRK